jgi:hypothetical protein
LASEKKYKERRVKHNKKDIKGLIAGRRTIEELLSRRREEVKSVMRNVC